MMVRQRPPWCPYYAFRDDLLGSRPQLHIRYWDKEPCVSRNGGCLAWSKNMGPVDQELLRAIDN
jgi:hypothetical protein